VKLGKVESGQSYDNRRIGHASSRSAESPVQRPDRSPVVGLRGHQLAKLEVIASCLGRRLTWQIVAQQQKISQQLMPGCGQHGLWMKLHAE
jgi:hypothetical protein